MQEEIRTLVKKRSDFEHQVLARGASPTCYARYLAWEISLEKLRQKRCKRLRIKNASAHSGQARIFSIFDRATKKHYGDLGLWMSYLNYAREVKATKKFKTVLTSAIRLHCTKPIVWLYAAKYSLEVEADMNGARSYMQRGTRFCTTTQDLWVEYAKLEMIYLAKIALRRRILGLDVDRTPKAITETATADNEFTEGADLVAIPDFKSNALNSSTISDIKVDNEATQDPATTPALQGAIPIAIFEAAQKQQFYTPAAGAAFFDMFSAFIVVPAQPRILQHVIDSLQASHPKDAATCYCYIRQPVVGIECTSTDFPGALGVALQRLKEVNEITNDRPALAKRVAAWLQPILETEGLDEAIKTVVAVTLRKLEK
jgi:U3 small nucleolar RNA-associated protein 6